MISRSVLKRLPVILLLSFLAIPALSLADISPATYGRVPLSFEVNRGQSDPTVRFVARGEGYSLFLTNDEAVLALRPARSGEAAVVRMRLAGANDHPPVSAEDPLPGRSNYFIGSDPAQWRKDVASFARVRYATVYPGVDLVYHGNQRQLEYDFVVAPHADPARIQLDFRGVRKLSLDVAGNLILDTALGRITQHKPVVYQDIDGQRRSIDGRYVVRGRRASFRLGRYDAEQPLVIDPVLAYSTYLGGNMSESGTAIAVDAAGSAYVVGHTLSANFPIAGPVQSQLNQGDPRLYRDAFVAKLNPAGDGLVYSTFLGGVLEDVGRGIAVDSAGNAYITGETSSSDFPTTSGAFQRVHYGYGGCSFPCPGNNDAFVAKLNPAGNALVYSTFVGGAREDLGRAIAVDGNGNACIMGTTNSDVVTNDPQSVPFPTFNAFQNYLNGVSGGSSDLFVTKLNAAGSDLVYSTYFGGSDTEYDSSLGAAIAVDANGNAYVTGMTYSTDFPTTAGAFQTTAGSTSMKVDAIVAKFSATGALVYSTYLGGSLRDDGRAIAVDSSGNAYVAGYTDSPNFPTASAFQPTFKGSGYLIGDAFVTKLNPSGSALVYSTFLGGTNAEAAYAIAVDATGRVYVAGLSGSGDFPTVDTMDPGTGVFVAKFNPAGSALEYSTFYGSGSADYELGMAIDSAGNAYITGYTGSPGLPAVHALQPTLGGAQDAFVAKIMPQPKGDANGDGSITAADVFVLINYLFGTGGTPALSADTNGDGVLNAADIFYLINYLYAGGPRPH